MWITPFSSHLFLGLVSETGQQNKAGLTWTTTSRLSNSFTFEAPQNITCLCFLVYQMVWSAKWCFTDSSLWAFHTDQLGAVSVCWTWFFCSTSSAWQCWIVTLELFKSRIRVLREKEHGALAVSTAAHCEQGRINTIMSWDHCVVGSKQNIREHNLWTMWIFCHLHCWWNKASYVVFLGWEWVFSFLQQCWIIVSSNLV